MAAALTSMLCMGAPLSSTWLRASRLCACKRPLPPPVTVVPGWAAIEELGGVDTVQVDADELFTADSVNLEDIRIFKGAASTVPSSMRPASSTTAARPCGACSARSSRTAPRSCTL